MAEPKWKRFERLIHQLHTPFAPKGAVVKLDDQIVGCESKGDGLFFVHDWKYTRGPSIVAGVVFFTVVPSIASLSPTSGAVGASVTITGTNFGSTQGPSTVKFNGTTATTITSWSATSIVEEGSPSRAHGKVIPGQKSASGKSAVW